MIAAIEEADKKSRHSGKCREWFGDSDEHIRKVAGSANGYLFETLLRAAEYNDVECVELLRTGEVQQAYSFFECMSVFVDCQARTWSANWG
jgi:hypothetical protein